MEINDKYDFAEYVGRNLFLAQFPATAEKIEYNNDKTGKYDLLVRDNDSLKYVEIKTIKDIYNGLDYFITLSDWDFLVHQTPTNAKALYVLFDDNNCIVYDLKAVHHLNLGLEGTRMLAKRHIHHTNKEKTPIVVLPFAECYQSRVSKPYKKAGSKQHFDFKVSEMNTRIGNGYLTEDYMVEIIKKIQEKK